MTQAILFIFVQLFVGLLVCPNGLRDVGSDQNVIDLLQELHSQGLEEQMDQDINTLLGSLKDEKRLDVNLAEEVLAKLTIEGWQGRVKTRLTSEIARELLQELHSQGLEAQIEQDINTLLGSLKDKKDLDVKLAEEVLAKLTSEGWQGLVKPVLTSGIARAAEIKKVWAGPLFKDVMAAEGKVTQAEYALKQAQEGRENTRQIFDRALLVAMGETPAS